MSEHLQQSLFENEQDENPLPSYRGGSLASLTALQESVKRLLTSVTSGRSTGESLAKLDRNGSWLKMYQDCFQAKMDGSFEEYSEILPSWGLMLDGVLIQPVGLEPYIDESEFLLLPTPCAADGKAVSKKRFNGSKFSHYSRTAERLRIGPDCPTNMNQNYSEVLMGLKVGWTEFNA